MRTVHLAAYGPPGNLKLTDAPIPTPLPDEVLVRIVSAGINPADAGAIRRERSYAPPTTFPAVPGWEFAGFVTSAGAEVDTVQAGDAIWGLARFPSFGGTFAQYSAVPVTDLAKAPSALPMSIAGALPLVGSTVIQCFAYRPLQPGDRVVIDGSSGGVGHVAIPLAVAAGAEVIAITTERHRDFAESLGAHTVLDARGGITPQSVGAVDFVLHSHSSDALPTLVGALGLGGALVSINLDVTPQLAALAAANGASAHNHIVHPDAGDLSALTIAVDAGHTYVHIDAEFELADIAHAYEKVASGHTVGKNVIAIS